MAFRGKKPIRTKIIINYKIVEQVSHVHLGNDTVYDRNYDTAVSYTHLDVYKRQV